MNEPSKGSASAASLEAAVAASPDDDAPRLVYADWLSARGDPRGEFIRVQCALAETKRPAKERNELRQREAALLRKHAADWLGGLAGHLLHRDDFGWQFARGWLDALHFPILREGLARALAESPEARLLRRLVVADNGPGAERIDREEA